MPINITPAEAAEKQARRLKASTPDIIRGIERVEVAPGQLAAAQVDKMRTNINKAIDSGKWGRRVAGVSLPDWKEQAINKGVPRIAAGIDAARPKVEKFFGQFLPHLEVIQKELEAMPSVTLEDNIGRAVHNMRRNADFELE
jgi:hypothetical protein